MRMQRVCDNMQKICITSSQTNDSTKKQKGTQSSSLSKMVFASDTFWERENLFSSMELHWLYQQHSGLGSYTRVVGNTNRFYVSFKCVLSVCGVVCVYTHALSYCFCFDLFLKEEKT